MLGGISKDNIFDKISDKLTIYLEVKDAVLENDYIEVLGDSVNVLKFLKNANALIAKKRFQSFLKGFYGIDQPSEYQLVKLYDYIDNEIKAEFIADIFSKVFLSNSKLACVIMGSIAQTLIEKKRDITHDDLVCAEALTKFFDYDIKNYKLICVYIDLYMSKHPGRKRKGFELNYSVVKYCLDNGAINSESVNLTLEKAISYQLFCKETEVDLDMDEDSISSSSVSTTEYCLITSPGQRLYKYLLDIGFSNIF